MKETLEFFLSLDMPILGLFGTTENTGKTLIHIFKFKLHGCIGNDNTFNSCFFLFKGKGINYLNISTTIGPHTASRMDAFRVTSSGKSLPGTLSILRVPPEIPEQAGEAPEQEVFA